MVALCQQFYLLNYYLRFWAKLFLESLGRIVTALCCISSLDSWKLLFFFISKSLFLLFIIRPLQLYHCNLFLICYDTIAVILWEMFSDEAGSFCFSMFRSMWMFILWVSWHLTAIPFLNNMTLLQESIKMYFLRCPGRWHNHFLNSLVGCLLATILCWNYHLWFTIPSYSWNHCVESSQHCAISSY